MLASSVYATVGHWDIYNSTNRYYLYVDLSQLQRKAKVISAELYLDRASASWDQDGLYQLHRVDGAWDTNLLTWNTQPAYSSEYVWGAYTQSGIYEFDVSSWVKDAVTKPRDYYGFMLKKPSETGDNSGLFATSEYPQGGAETQPYMVIAYSIPGR